MSDSARPQRWQPTRLPCPWDSPGKNTGVVCHFLLQCMKVKSESEVAQSCPTTTIGNSSVKIISVIQSCPTLFNPRDCSMPGFPVPHQVLEFTQTHVNRVSDSIQPSHPLSSPSPPTFNLSPHQGLFQGVSSSHQVAKVLEFQLQHQSFQ